MNEFYLALKMMGESRYKWPVPPERPAVVQVVKRPASLSPADAEELRKAMDRVGRCLTGKLVKDGDLYVPEVNEKCLESSR